MIQSLRLLLLLLIGGSSVTAQQKVAELTAPSDFSTHSDAVGYYNKYNRHFVLCQQNGDSLYRVLCDSALHIVSKYAVWSKERAYRKKKKYQKRIFVCDLATAEHHYEVYQQDQELFVYWLNFKGGTDQLTATVSIKSTYADESLLAVMAAGQQLRYLTHSKKQNTLLLYSCSPANGSTVKAVFPLPKTNLSAAEIKNYNEEVKLKLANDMVNFSVERMDGPNIISAPYENRIFYNDEQAYLLLKMPYNIGYYVMRVLFNEGTLTQKNLFVNSLQEDYYCGDPEKEKVLSATMADTVLMVNNNNAENLQLHFFNAVTLAPLQSYNVNITDSIHTIVQSKLKQKGSYGSEKELKELENKKLYFRRKHSGYHCLSVSALSRDAMVLTTGSYVETGSVGKTLLSLTSMGFSYIGLSMPGNGFSAFLVSDYLSAIQRVQKVKYRYLYTHAKFSRTDFKPVGQTEVYSFVDVLNEQLTDGRYNLPSSFFVQRGNTYLVGVLNKESGRFELLKYAD
jgi:hypothetical protein